MVVKFLYEIGLDVLVFEVCDSVGGWIFIEYVIICIYLKYFSNKLNY